MGKISAIFPRVRAKSRLGYTRVCRLISFFFIGKFGCYVCRMAHSSSYRLAARVGAYVKFNDDDGREYCKACNINS